MTGGEEVAADVCLAFPLPDSRGTQDCIRTAQAAGIPRIRQLKYRPYTGPDPIRAWMMTISAWRMSDYLRKEFGIHASPDDWGYVDIDSASS